MKRQWNKNNWQWTGVLVLAFTLQNANVFSQQACPMPRDPSDSVKIEVMTQEVQKAKGDFEDAGAITKRKYLEELKKLVILISTKQDAIKKIRGRLDLDEIALKALDQQIQDQLVAVVGAQTAAELTTQWNHGATDAERSQIIADFASTKRSYQSLILSLAKKSGVGNDNLKKVKDVSMEFASIQPGEFRMGSSEGSNAERAEKGRNPDEAPRNVKIRKPFEIGKTEFTQFQYVTVMGTVSDDFKEYYKADKNAPDYMVINGIEINANRPMIYVSWNDARDLAQKLSKQDSNYNYRLPTEAEWEFAARAGSKTAYSFGNSTQDLDEYAVYDVYAPTQVASKKSNPARLYDVHGNVWEWCKDGYCAAPKGNEDPQGDDSSSNRVMRGGSWSSDDPRYLRSAYRSYWGPDGRNFDVGFRLVRTAK